MAKIRILIAMLVLLGVNGLMTSLKAQSSLTVDASQVFSTFHFVDSLGEKDKSYTGSYSGAYSFGYRFTNEKGLVVRGGLGMRKGGATAVFDNSNYSWDLQYLHLMAGAGYQYHVGKFEVYATVSPYFSYLLKANQRINNENFDIKKLNYVQNIDAGAIGSLGAQMSVTDGMSIYLELNYQMGLYNIEGTSRGNTFIWQSAKGQQAYNRAISGTVGLAFSLGK